MAAPDLARLRELATSILGGVQQLEDLGVQDGDEAYSNVTHLIEEADDAVGSLVEWVEDGRPDL